MPSKTELAHFVRSLATNPDTNHLADVFGVSQHTIRMWMRDPRFEDLMRAFIHERQQEAHIRFASAMNTAIDTLIDVMSPKTRSAMARTTAASKIIDTALAYQDNAETSSQQQAMELLRRIAQNQQSMQQSLPQVEHGGLLPATLRSKESDLERHFRNQRKKDIDVTEGEFREAPEIANDDDDDDHDDDQVFADNL